MNVIDGTMGGHNTTLQNRGLLASYNMTVISYLVNEHTLRHAASFYFMRMAKDSAFTARFMSDG